MFETYILPVLMFAVMGLVAGILLTVVSKLFEVKTDPRTEEVNEALPQINCGACGYSGCSDYAKAIVEKGAPTNLCRPGGAKVAAKVNDIMGGDASMEISKEIAIVRCSGDCDTEKYTFDFDGVQTCANAKRFYGGMWGCKYGCIGLGDCVSVCPNGAVNVENGLAKVTAEKCVGCGLCADACPNNIIDMRPFGQAVDVMCSSHDMGKAVKAVCSSGCIGCKICEKQCEFDAIHVTDNLARIDYSKCTACGKCAAKCPVHVIHMDK